MERADKTYDALLEFTLEKEIVLGRCLSMWLLSLLCLLHFVTTRKSKKKNLLPSKADPYITFLQTLRSHTHVVKKCYSKLLFENDYLKFLKKLDIQKVSFKVTKEYIWFHMMFWSLRTLSVFLVDVFPWEESIVGNKSWYGESSNAFLFVQKDFHFMFLVIFKS